MGIGMGVARQKVGLNRVGRYMEAVRGGGGAATTRGGTAALRNEPWRRITGITVAVEERLSPAERRAGFHSG